MRYIITFCLLTIFLNALTQKIPAIDSMISKGIMGCGIIKSAEPTNKTIVLRCRATLQQDREPLIIIDGILIEFKRLNDLDPNDIESVYVLKDASATAIYGCRASSGVIIITTKNSNLRKFIIKDFVDGSKIAGATVTFISQNDKKNTLMFVANGEGMINTDKLRSGAEYKVIVTSVGYKKFFIAYKSVRNVNATEFILEREMINCPEVRVIAYPLIRCSRISCELETISICNWEKYENVENEKKLIHANNIYPNPAQKGSTVTIDLKNETGEDLQLKVFSLDGRLLLLQTKKAMKGNNRFTVQADTRWTAGTYLVQLSDAKGKVVSKDKLIIQ